MDVDSNPVLIDADTNVPIDPKDADRVLMVPVVTVKLLKVPKVAFTVPKTAVVPVRVTAERFEAVKLAVVIVPAATLPENVAVGDVRLFAKFAYGALKLAPTFRY